MVKRLIMGGCLLVLLGWSGFIVWHGVSLASGLHQIQAQLENPAPAKLPQQIHQVSADLTALHFVIRPFFPVLRLLAPLPQVGPLLAQSPDLLEYATGLAQAGDNVFEGLAPLLSEGGFSSSAAQASSSERLLQVIVQGQNHFSQALPPLLLAARARQNIHGENLPERVKTLYNRVDANFDLMGSGLELLGELPGMLGQSAPVNYLILAQNRDELRPTGGFITGIGLLQFDQGRLARFNLGDSYQVDDYSKGYPPPPEPIQRIMLSGYWVPRDANWSPDFPTAAQQAQRLYTLSTGIKTNGVLAFDQAAVRSILKVIGPVHVSLFSEPVSQANIELLMQQAWAPGSSADLNNDWWVHRKDFMKELGNAILNQMTQGLDTEKMKNIAVQCKALIEQGHLLVYFNEQSAQELLNQMNLDGAVKPGSGDYIQLVDTNMGFNKVDPLIQRSLDYQMDFSNKSQPTAELTVAYVHSGKTSVPCKHEANYGNGQYTDMQMRCYWDYWRVYTAPGNTLISGESPSVPAEELLSNKPWSGAIEDLPGEAGAAVHGGLLVLPPGKTQMVTLAWNLPPTRLIAEADSTTTYHLRIAKQAGLDTLPVRLQVRLPQGMVMNLGDSWTASGDEWVWQGKLLNTRDFTITFHPGP